MMHMSHEKEWKTIAGVVGEIAVDAGGIRIETDQGSWAFRAYGDCCSEAYIHEPATVAEESKGLIGQRIVSASEEEVEQENIDSGDVRDIHFYTIQGERSALKVTLYVDHNGYYGGELLPVIS